ncbi:DUF317 domain-containing protein [Streptomyces sp. NPDC004690]
MPDHEVTDVDGDVYVAPRYLARATCTGDPALDPLLQLGWDLSRDGLGNVYVTAPDHKVRLGYLPEGPDGGLWRINGYTDPFGPPAWGACFSDTCPIEFVTAFTSVLAQAYEQGPSSCLAKPAPGSKDLESFSAVAPLINRGWLIDHPRWHAPCLRSPDKLAELDYATGALDPEAELTTKDARWKLWAGPKHDPYWYATASTYTPVALLKAVTECISDPAPLPRWRAETYSYVGEQAQLTPVRPPSPPTPTPTPLDVQRAAASRRPAARSAPSVPRWSTTSRSAVSGPRR